MPRKPKPLTSAQRQAAAVESLRAEGGRRISLSVPAALAKLLDARMRKTGMSQTDVIVSSLLAALTKQRSAS